LDLARWLNPKRRVSTFFTLNQFIGLKFCEVLRMQQSTEHFESWTLILRLARNLVWELEFKTCWASVVKFVYLLALLKCREISERFLDVLRNEFESYLSERVVMSEERW